jgi:hypothetical protein
MNDIIIVKHKCVRSSSAGESECTSFVISFGRHAPTLTSEDINTDQGQELHGALAINGIGFVLRPATHLKRNDGSARGTGKEFRLSAVAADD